MKNDKRDILLHLYGESESESDLRTLLRNPDLKEEYTALSEAKFRLDLRKRERPDAAVMNTIMAAARTGIEPSGMYSRVDRGPIARGSRLRKVLVPALSFAAVVLFSVGVGLFSVDWSSDQRIPLAESAVNDLVPPESLYRFVPPHRDAVSPSTSQDSELEWDDRTTLSSVNDRLNSLKPSDLLDWGESAVPLESLPNSNRPGFQTVGSIRK
ncbi:MAG: hypothetical protein O3B41_07620 [Bacteroidetes bacterium]|nr:hypothetical protein [Bacteroidota bacterium]